MNLCEENLIRLAPRHVLFTSMYRTFKIICIPFGLALDHYFSSGSYLQLRAPMNLLTSCSGRKYVVAIDYLV